MSAPSRQYEIRRRRTRKATISDLRERYRRATAAGDRDNIIEKMKKVHPGLSETTLRDIIEKK